MKKTSTVLSFIVLAFLFSASVKEASALILPSLPEGAQSESFYHQVALTDGCLNSAGGSPRAVYAGTYTYGLYGNCQNLPSATQLARLNAAASSVQPLDTSGNPSGSGHIVLLAIGHSINRYIWGSSASNDLLETPFSEKGSVLWDLGLATNASSQPSSVPNLNPALVVLDGSQNGQESNLWINNLNDHYTRIANSLLTPVWQPNIYQSYWLGTLIVDSNGHTEKSTGSNTCTSGSTTPTWSTTGGATTDGTCTWTDEGIQATNPLRLTAAQVQVISGSFTLVFQPPSSGTVTTNGTAVTYSSGTDFSGCVYVKDSGANLTSGWDAYPITINGVQYIVVSCSDNHHMTLATSAGVQSSPVSYTLQNMNQTLPSANSDAIWNAYYVAGSLREAKIQYPNLQLALMYSDPYFGYNMGFHRDTILRNEPWGFETGFSVQEVVMAQTNQMDTLTAVTSCTVSGTTVTCTTGGLPASFTGSPTVQVAGASNSTFDTPCATTACLGAVATISGSSFSYTDASASGTSTGGHVSIIFDSVVGGLESQDGTSAVVAWGPYIWYSGTTARSDGGQSYCEDEGNDGIHPSSLTRTNTTVVGSSCGFLSGQSDNPHGGVYGGQGFLSNLFLNYLTNCTTANSCTPPWGGTAYGFGPITWTNSWMCASGHTGPGCQ